MALNINNISEKLNSLLPEIDSLLCNAECQRNKTLDELLKNKKITDEEWLSILFQVIFGLAVAQKHFNFS